MSEEKIVSTSQSTLQITQNLLKIKQVDFVQEGIENSVKSKNIQDEDRFREIYNQRSQQIQVAPQNFSKNSQEWTLQEENLLYELHNRKGNKWVQIARQLKKNDNSVKNHYHSKLRRTIRKLNYCIVGHLKGELKPLRNNIISKIVQTAQGIYQKKQGQQKQLAFKAYSLKNRVLSYSELNQQQICQLQKIEIRKLIIQLSEFQNELKFSLRPQGKVKAGSNKYKGKQILSLLNQNIKLQKVQQTRNKLSTSPIQVVPIYNQHLQLENNQGIAQQQQKNSLLQSSNLQTAQSGEVKQLSYFSSFTLYNPQSFYPAQPLLYPIFQQPTLGITSFPFFKSQNDLFRFSFDGFN